MKTAAEVKQDFIRCGVTAASWAREHGYNLRTVYSVLGGSLKGHYGVAHRIAVDLGLKEPAQDATRAPVAIGAPVNPIKI